MQTNVITIKLTANDHPESRDVGGKTVTKVRARQSQGKDRDGEWKPSVWLDVEAWGGSWAQTDLAELRKGDVFTVTGRLTVREWEDREGNKREFWGIRADSVDAPRKPNGKDGYQASDATAERRQTQHRETANRQRSTAPREEVPYTDDEDIPF